MPAFVHTIPCRSPTRSGNSRNYGFSRRPKPLIETSFAPQSVPTRSRRSSKRGASTSPSICARDVKPRSSLLGSGNPDPGERDQSSPPPSVEQLTALFDTLSTKLTSAGRRNFSPLSNPSVEDSNPNPNSSPAIPNSLIDTTLPGASPLHTLGDKDMDDATITDVLLGNPGVEKSYANEENDVFNVDSNDTNPTRNRSTRLKRSGRKNASASQDHIISQVALRSGTDEDLVINMLAESYALSSDFLPTIEDSPLPLPPAFSTDNDTVPRHSEDVRSPSLQHDTQPCIQSAVQLERTLSAVHKRQTFLSAESGEDTLFSSEADPSASLGYMKIPKPLSDNEQLKDFFNNIREATKENFFIGSVRGSLPINPYELANPEDLCAITSRAPQIVASVSSPPNTYRPSLALDSAIVKLRNPPCPRCRAPTEKEVLDEDGVCETCYSSIFLQSPISNSPRDSIISRENAALEEARIAQQATSVLHAPFMSESASSATSNPKVKRPLSPSSNFRNGNEATGSGGSSYSGQDQAPSVGDGWRVAASDRSLRTINPIRNLVQNIRVNPNPSKKTIKLSVGDPTVYGNLKISASIVGSLCQELKSGRSNGYSLSMGDAKARTAIAERYSTPSSQLSSDDVFITSGASGALELAIGALVNEGDNILLPSPGFPLFRTLAEGFGIECRFYELNPDQDWQVKLEDLTRVANKRTRAILVNNPSNPCGSVFSRDHMEDIMAVAAALRLPVIADEVYADMVFTGEFNSFGAVSAEVPTLVVGGISKQFVVPGWRVGWVLVHDRENIFEKAGVRRGLRQLTTRMICANTPVQMVIPLMLEDHMGFRAVMKELQENADFTAKSLKSVEGLKCVEARGAMYVMVGVDVSRMGLRDDMEFVERLYEEEAVFVLPGQCFKAPNYVRVVFAAPKDVLADAFSRIAAFCKRKIDST